METRSSLRFRCIFQDTPVNSQLYYEDKALKNLLYCYYFSTAEDESVEAPRKLANISARNRLSDKQSFPKYAISECLLYMCNPKISVSVEINWKSLRSAATEILIVRKNLRALAKTPNRQLKIIFSVL